LQRAGYFLSREEVTKYFEVRFFSLALMAIGIFVLCLFLIFFFISQGQYVYVVAVIALAVIVLLVALELSRYAKSLKRGEKAAVRPVQARASKSTEANYLRII
jgi:uncharacterized membrane protein YfhO